MSVRLLTWAEYPALSQLGPSDEAVWPEYHLHGDVVGHWRAPPFQELPEY